MKRKNNETKIFGKRLQGFRIARNLSVVNLADQIGVSSSTYREWEQGRAITGLPYPKLTRALGISLAELFGIEDFTTLEVLKKLQAIEDIISELRVAL